MEVMKKIVLTWQASGAALKEEKRHPLPVISIFQIKSGNGLPDIRLKVSWALELITLLMTSW